MFKTHHSKKSSGPFIIFRLFLSLVIFVVMLIGLYAAFKEFSGTDPLKMDPKSVIQTLIATKDPSQLFNQFKQIIHGQAGALSNVTLPQVAGIEASSSAIPVTSTSKTIAFSFLLVADSHDDSVNLTKALQQGKQHNPNIQFVIGLGDYTNVGTRQELTDAKNIFDAFGVRYFLIPGDHDLWNGRDKTKDALSDYSAVFGKPYQTFTYDNVSFFLLYNSDNYLGMGADQKNWLQNELDIAQKQHPMLMLAFVHEPLYHPSSDHMMGKVTPSLKLEAQDITRLLKSYGVQEVFAGDVHYFQQYTEPETGMKMTTLGAVTSVPNTQNPRYGIVTVYTDGSYDVQDTEIK